MCVWINEKKARTICSALVWGQSGTMSSLEIATHDQKLTKKRGKTEWEWTWEAIWRDERWGSARVGKEERESQRRWGREKQTKSCKMCQIENDRKLDFRCKIRRMIKFGSEISLHTKRDTSELMIIPIYLRIQWAKDSNTHYFNGKWENKSLIYQINTIQD